MRLVVRSGSFVGADVSGVVLDVLTAGDSLALAALVEALLVAAGVLARVRQTVDAADVYRALDTAQHATRRNEKLHCRKTNEQKTSAGGIIRN